MNRPTWKPAYVGIGSNLDDPENQVKRGLDALKDTPQTKLIARSKLYRSPPLGPQDQPEFVNAVAGLLTQLDAQSLLIELKSLERKLGRAEPAVRWGARIIDFDLLVFASERIDSETLRVPHPGIAKRAFVIAPLMDIAPSLDVPGVGRVEALESRIDMTSVRAL